MPIAKTITDSTTEAWVTESPIRYEARATSSSSYTSPQAAQTKTPARTRNRPGARADRQARRALAAPGRRGLGRARRSVAVPGWAGACGSITQRTVRHRTTASCHPHVWKLGPERILWPGRVRAVNGGLVPFRFRLRCGWVRAVARFPAPEPQMYSSPRPLAGPAPSRSVRLSWGHRRIERRSRLGSKSGNHVQSSGVPPNDYRPVLDSELRGPARAEPAADRRAPSSLIRTL